MKSLENYINEYSESHQNRVNRLIHKVCVPAILFSILGIIKAIPVPIAWPLWLDWSSVLIILILIYYSLFKNFRVLIAIIILIAPMITLLELLRPRFFILSLIIFLVAWIGQFIGHKIEGKKPSFFSDIFFLLIGPIWTMNEFAEQMGINLKISNAKDIC